MLDVGAVALMVSVLIWWSVVLQARWKDYDFNHYYASGRILLEGRNPYTTSLKAMSRALGFRYTEDLSVATYPPGFLWMFAALAILPPRAAFAIWTGSELLCLGIILWLTRHLLANRLSLRGWLFVAALATTSRVVSYHLYFSQSQLLLAALVLAAYAAQRAGRCGWACLAVSTAGMLKLYPFVLLPWFIWSGGGGVRGRCARLIGVIGFVLAVVTVTGPGLWRDFFRAGMPAIAEWEETGRTFQFSLPALLNNLGVLLGDFHLSPEAKRWLWLGGTGAGLAVLAAAYGVCLATRRDPEAQFCMLCTAMLIGTVTVQGHYFVFLVFPLTVAALRIAAKPTSGQVIGLSLMILAFNCVEPPSPRFFEGHMLLYVLAGDLPLYGLIALAAFFWRELLYRQGPHSIPAIADGRQ
jgi:hypothetical protein